MKEWIYWHETAYLLEPLHLTFIDSQNVYIDMDFAFKRIRLNGKTLKGVLYQKNILFCKTTLSNSFDTTLKDFALRRCGMWPENAEHFQVTCHNS